MPEIKLKHVVSCSSEDRNNPADNLLKTEGTHKWRTAAAGQKSASVVLQFEKASEIQGIDIGNEGSAFVEVLVGKSTDDSDFKVLLVSSAFMGPGDSRNNTNRNTVRIFAADKLSKPVSSEKWDIVKVVCTQPFNKSTTYGLSFLKFHSSPDASKPSEKEVKKLGGFFVKKEVEDDELKVGDLFANRGKQESTVISTPKGAVGDRTTSHLAEESYNAISQPRENMANSSTANSPHSRTSKPPKNKRRTAMSDSDTDMEDDVPIPGRRLQQQSSSQSPAAIIRLADTLPLKKFKTEPMKCSAARNFRGLMGKVTFVLSGFQNPYRAELRDKALEMGAVYKPDWCKGCTHLICAFTNTPKYNQVKGQGRIVSKAWITDCYKQKKLLPWRKYRLGDAESPDDSSKEEDGESDTDDDTDEEIRRVQKLGHASKKSQEDSQLVNQKADPTFDLFGHSTDEDEAGKESVVAVESENGSNSDIPGIADFFREKHFFLYGDFSPVERRLLKRYIAAYDGVLEDFMNGRVKYVVTPASWDDNFEEALSENPNLIFVKPQWIHVCHQYNKLLPYQPYVIKP